MSIEETKSPKKPYEKPVLRIYGDMKAITRSHSNQGGLDGPKSKIDKTA